MTLRRRTVLFGAGAGAAAATVPYTPQPAPSGQSRYTAAQPAPVHAAPVPRQFAPLGIDQGAHAAFPAATRLPDGRVVLMWRESDGHLDLDGGRIMRSVGDPIAGTWSAPSEVVVDGGETGVTPHTGPAALSYVDGRLWLTYFFWHNGLPSGARVTYSTDEGATWSPSVRVDGGRPWAAISSPVVKANGRLWTAFYTSDTASTADPESAYAAWSTNNGDTWTSARIAVGAAGNDFQEPWVVAGSNGKVVFLMRDGTWRALASRTVDAAGVWSPLNRSVITSATGNPATVGASNGRLYLVYRHTVTRDAMLAESRDNGVTWQVDPVPLLRAPANLGQGSLGMTYAAPVELGPGLVWTPIGLEQSLDASRIYTGWL